MSLALKPTHASVKAYYETLHQLGQLYIDHEGYLGPLGISQRRRAATAQHDFLPGR